MRFVTSPTGLIMYHKLAVIADIHGNYPALLAVLNEIQRLGCDRIVSLGDVAGYYCMINECIDCCREHGIVNVLGNHDFYLVSGEGCPRSMSANKCLDYQRKVISPQNMQWLSGSLPEYKDSVFWGVHGSWKDLLDDYLDSFDFDSPPQPVHKVYASAHSHIQKKQTGNGIVHFNPGSVGQPRDNDPRAAFAVLCPPDHVSLHRVQYDIGRISGAMSNAGFESRYYSCLENGTKIQTYRTQG